MEKCQNPTSVMSPPPMQLELFPWWPLRREMESCTRLSGSNGCVRGDLRRRITVSRAAGYVCVAARQQMPLTLADIRRAQRGVVFARSAALPTCLVRMEGYSEETIGENEKSPISPPTHTQATTAAVANLHCLELAWTPQVSPAASLLVDRAAPNPHGVGVDERAAGRWQGSGHVPFACAVDEWKLSIKGLTPGHSPRAGPAVSYTLPVSPSSRLRQNAGDGQRKRHGPWTRRGCAGWRDCRPSCHQCLQRR